MARHGFGRSMAPDRTAPLQEDAVIWPRPGGEREVYVRIIPSQITGRRIEIR
jgi:hypothetical protein